MCKQLIIDANILITIDGVIKICDFGLARYFKKDDGTTPYSGDKVTLNYRPPELLFKENLYYNSKVDISIAVSYLPSHTYDSHIGL